MKNYQIQNKKTTVGELDFILQKNHSPIHLEVIYKFYLYDDTFGNSEIEHWIGPNRNDNLVKKLTKLKEVFQIVKEFLNFDLNSDVIFDQNSKLKNGVLISDCRDKKLKNTLSFSSNLLIRLHYILK